LAQREKRGEKLSLLRDKTTKKRKKGKRDSLAKQFFTLTRSMAAGKTWRDFDSRRKRTKGGGKENDGRKKNYQYLIAEKNRVKSRGDCKRLIHKPFAVGSVLEEEERTKLQGKNWTMEKLSGRDEKEP